MSLNPKNHKSNGYGFVWFKEAASAKKAIEAAALGKTTFTVEPYKPLKDLSDITVKYSGTINDPESTSDILRKMSLTESGLENSIIVSGFDDDTKEEELI